MVLVMGWKVGSIEVISLVIFVGYSVTYSLHVAHAYAEAEVLGLQVQDEDVEASDKELQDFISRWNLGREAHQLLMSLEPTFRLNFMRENYKPPDGSRDTSTIFIRERLRYCRRERAKMAIVHMGTAVLSSALSTFGSSIFLLFCTMIIFVKLGLVVIAVCLLSVVCAFVALPAFLMMSGPPPEPWISRCLRFLDRSRARLKGQKVERLQD